MIRALGYSVSDFDPTDPGRLCRGRERWIEPYELEDDPNRPPISRLIISGAQFSDDSARDALRGLPHAAVDVASVIAALFPRRTLVAFMEDGHASEIPEAAVGVEAYSGYRAGGRSQVVMVRWQLAVSGIREVRQVVGDEPLSERVRGFAVLDGDTVDEGLSDLLFLLVGMSTLDSPPARFQPAALPEVLQHVRAVVLLHRDKHGSALGIYSREPVKTSGRLEGLCDKVGSLLVKFAIPPMLARWDRALAELRGTWNESERGPFPVPESTEPSTWEPRRRRRRRDRSDAPGFEDGPQSTEKAPPDADLDAALQLEDGGEE
jgi:hypothetical protein